MKTYIISVVIAVFIFFSSCSNQPAGPEISKFDGIAKTDGTVSEAVILNFVAVLDGSQEVPPVNTRSRGQAMFQLSFDGTELSYNLNVANIQNITQAHIHIAPVGENGPVVAWLYPSGPPPILIPGRFSGVLARGTITADDLVGPLAGMTLEDLLFEMNDGNTYANVRTSQNPGGEIRGQIIFGNGMLSAEE